MSDFALLKDGQPAIYKIKNEPKLVRFIFYYENLQTNH